MLNYIIKGMYIFFFFTLCFWGKKKYLWISASTVVVFGQGFPAKSPRVNPKKISLATGVRTMAGSHAGGRSRAGLPVGRGVQLMLEI